MPPLINLAGKKFNRLSVLERVSNNPINDRVRWKCKCDCGNVAIINSKGIVSGRTKSCGCLLTEILIKRNSKHGLSKSSFYALWKNMVRRGSGNDSSSLVSKYYTNKGVSICNRWKEFENFKEDMYRDYLIHRIRHGRDNTTIDRIDTNGDYTPENCRWTTWKKQNRNSSTQRLFLGKRIIDEYLDVGTCKTEFAEEYGLSRKGICNCLNSDQKSHKGWRFQYLEEKN